MKAITKKMDKELRKALRQDILDRYDNEEYWNNELIENWESFKTTQPEQL